MPHPRFSRGAMAIAAVAFASSVHAAQPLPAVLKGAVGAGVKVVKQFSAPSGLTGWVLAQGGKHSVVYTTADRKTLIAGVLIDQRGQNLSSLHEAAQVPQPDLSAAFLTLEKSAYVAEGATRSPKTVIYAWTAPAGVTAAAHPAIATAIQANGEAMEAFGIDGTPGVVWRDRQGKVRVKSGMPRLSELPALTGLPAQRNTNPALEKFM